MFPYQWRAGYVSATETASGQHMKMVMEGYVFPLLESIHYYGSEELSKTIERIRDEIF